MQSVFKLELAVTVLKLVEQGRYSLDQPVRFLSSDRILPTTVSPLQQKYPQAGVDVPLQELIRFAVVEGDNVAADIGRRIAIAIFLTDSTADDATRDRVIAAITRAI
jgi:beta-lactamase class A